MVFSTIIFLFRFLPITLALYYLAPAKLKNTVLFLCSLVFYCWGEVRFFPVMVALILINYLSGLAIEHFDAKPRCAAFFLLVALIGSLGMLFYFKYANFVLRSVNACWAPPLPKFRHWHPAAGHQLLHLPDPFLLHRCLPPGCKSRAQYHRLRRLCGHVPAAHRSLSSSTGTSPTSYTSTSTAITSNKLKRA